MLLEQKDKDKFAIWLTNEIDTSLKLLHQMEHLGTAIPEVLIKKHKAEIVACKVVLIMLTECETIRI